jgi:hypothetical protein
MIFFHTSSEIIGCVAYDTYDDFQHVNFIFSQRFIFWGLFNDKTKVIPFSSPLPPPPPFTCQKGFQIHKCFLRKFLI